jgi:hypothetical protein
MVASAACVCAFMFVRVHAHASILWTISLVYSSLNVCVHADVNPLSAHDSNKHPMSICLPVGLSVRLFLPFKLQLARCDFIQQCICIYIYIHVCVCVCVCARARVYIYIIILQVEADHEKGDTGEGRRRRETHSSKQRSNLRL